MNLLLHRAALRPPARCCFAAPTILVMQTLSSGESCGSMTHNFSRLRRGSGRSAPPRSPAGALTRGSLTRYIHIAGWSSPVARWAHNPKVVGSNPTPATKESITYRRRFPKQDPIIPQSEMAPPNQSFFIEGLWCLSPPFARPAFRQTPALRLGYWLCASSPSSPSIDIHRRLDRGVTHQFLLHLHRSAGLIKP